MDNWNTETSSLYIKSVAYNCEESHTSQLDFCNWLADDGNNEVSIMFRQVWKCRFY